MTNDSQRNKGTVRLAIQAPGALELAVELLRQGHVIAFPTDTVYGIGAHALRDTAVARLYRVKGRPVHLPIPVLLPAAAAMDTVCVDIPEVAWQIAERLWPGGLSLVLYRSALVPDAVAGGGPTIAVRVPDEVYVRELCARLGAPLAATSANRHGEPPLVTADEVESALAGCVSLLLDGGVCRGGVASTVLDLTVSPPIIVRQGPVTAEELAGLVDLQAD